MYIFRRLLAIFVAALVVVASGVSVAHAESNVNVYNTPGGHVSADRLWKTKCEKYSSNVVRCRTEIWATQVVLQKKKFVQRTGWTFNNLSYLPAPKETWVGNNLARNNARWLSGGKTWKTECDTATTGRGGCRSFIWTKQVQAKKSGSKWTYSNVEGWVFNNLLLFSSPTISHVSLVPNGVLECDGQWIEPTGLRCSPLKVDALPASLERLEYLVRAGGEICASHLEASPEVRNSGITYFPGRSRGNVFVVDDKIPTKHGARVGMTVGDVRGIYGAAFAVVKKSNFGVQQYFGTVREGAYELQFRVKGAGEHYAPTMPLEDTDEIGEISAQRYVTDVSWDGC